MAKLPLVDGILRYVLENNVPFCIPGHKSGKGFMKDLKGRELYRNFVNCDITEVDGTDNLHHPDGIIKEAEELLSRFYGSKKSYFLVNGSTSGNLAMIFSCFDEDDKIIVERNCHRSILNGIILRKLRAVYVDNTLIDESDAPFSVDLEHLIHTMDENRDAKGIILTYPNYYGICTDLEKIIQEAKKRNMKVLVDGAHGAHFGVSHLLPKSAVKLGADAVVVSSHKTLPSLTQTAYLHINEGMDLERVDFYVSAFLSTSPSYMMMCSMDYARGYLEDYGKEEYEKLLITAEEYRNKINTLKYVHVLGRQDLKRIKWSKDIDLTRYVLTFREDLSSDKVMAYLRENAITAEMNDGKNIVLIFSPFNTEEEFQRLYDILKECPIEDMIDCKNTNKLNFFALEGKTVMEPYEVMSKNKKRINIENAAGSISASMLVPYPPGIPAVLMGEILRKESLDMIKYYLDTGKTVLGVENGQVLVVDEYN